MTIQELKDKMSVVRKDGFIRVGVVISAEASIREDVPSSEISIIIEHLKDQIVYNLYQDRREALYVKLDEISKTNPWDCEQWRILSNELISIARFQPPA